MQMSFQLICPGGGAAARLEGPKGMVQSRMALITPKLPNLRHLQLVRQLQLQAAPGRATVEVPRRLRVELLRIKEVCKAQVGDAQDPLQNDVLRQGPHPSEGSTALA